MTITIQIGTCLSDLKSTIRKDTSLSDDVKTSIFNFIDNDKDDQISHSVEKTMFELLLSGVKEVKLHIKDAFRNWSNLKNIERKVDHDNGSYTKVGHNNTSDGGEITRTRTNGTSGTDDETRLSYENDDTYDEFLTDEDGNITCRRTIIGNKLYIDKDLDGVYDSCQDWF